MSESSLSKRLSAEFASAKAKLASFQEEQAREYQAKQERMVQFDQKLDQLRDVIVPKLETLATHFEGNVQSKPTISPGHRQATFSFKSELATIELTFSASTDPDVRQVVFACDLLILPVFIQYERHTELSFPLDGVDSTALGNWLDDRILAFVKTYFAMHENRQYWRDHLVRDPEAGIDFPRFAAASTLTVDGKTLYFASLATRDAYAARHSITEK